LYKIIDIESLLKEALALDYISHFLGRITFEFSIPTSHSFTSIILGKRKNTRIPPL
jgi:hypothetical protein